jgi:pimeloyl-ACP methyl ester carboxylesterase
VRRLTQALGVWAFLFGGLMGCSQLPTDSRERPDALLGRLGFQSLEVEPTLKSWLRSRDVSVNRTDSVASTARPRRLRVYIEGDGAAWWSHRLPPADPTPTSSVVLHLAASDPQVDVAYLARPCQYLSAQSRAGCPHEWWTSARYGPEVIAQTQRLLDALVQRSGAQGLELIGHSGGGTVAVLAAAERQDVTCLVTLAAPLDIDAWTTHHQVARLHRSLNPSALPAGQPAAPAVHLFGERDTVVPVGTLGGYAHKLLPRQIMVMPGWGHTEGWRWRTQWQSQVGCLGDS